MRSLLDYDLPIVRPTTVHLMADTTADSSLLVTTGASIALSTIATALFLVEELLRGVLWIAVTTEELILGSMTTERHVCHPGTQEPQLIHLPNGSLEIIETPGKVEIIMNDSITEETSYRARIYHKNTAHISATCHRLDTKDQTGQTTHLCDHRLPTCRRPSTVLQSIRRVQL